jgi:MFS family permease
LGGLCAALMLVGAGSGTQHPIGSAAVSRAYGEASRGPLGTYNFTGDLGKAALPALTSVLLTHMPWRHSLWVLAGLGIATAIGVALLMPPIGRAHADAPEHRQAGAGRGGFPLLFAIGMLDSGVRMGLLTFLPFLLKAKGASLPDIGLALALVFIGGAGGKFACGWLGARIGVLRSVLLTEGGTAACILAVLVLPLSPCLVVLPLLGTMLNGTSSVLYGTVPELTSPHQTERAFALFYTGVIGSGALSPVLYGALGDVIGANWATAVTAIAALATFPLAFALAPHLAPRRGAA